MQDGGLGLKSLKVWNLAGNFYQIWRVIKPNATSIWSVWLQKKLLTKKILDL